MTLLSDQFFAPVFNRCRNIREINRPDNRHRAELRPESTDALNTQTDDKTPTRQTQRSYS